MAVGAPPQFTISYNALPSDHSYPAMMKTDQSLSHLLPGVSRKRIREDDEFIDPYHSEIDLIVSNHTKKLRMELEERQKQERRLLMAAIGEDVVKLVREKDEHILRLSKLNFLLQERVKTLFMENQLWRDLALTNEATANSLRGDLEQVLAHVAADERVSDGAVTEDDVESCCDSSNSGHVKAEAETSQGGPRMCRKCGLKESTVLLLPCRHLCLCTMCGSSLVSSCPVCFSSMNATVHINMSS